jgi:hypothetical protein
MPNNIDIKLNSKDIPATAMAVNSAALLQIILVFVSFWGLMGMLGNFSKTVDGFYKRAGNNTAAYVTTFDAKYAKCIKDNPHRSEGIYDANGILVGQHPYVDCGVIAEQAANAVQYAYASN